MMRRSLLISYPTLPWVQLGLTHMSQPIAGGGQSLHIDGLEVLDVR